jgi:hypothetical protein
MHPRDTLAMGTGHHPAQQHGRRTVMLALLALGAIAGALIVSGCPGDDEDGRIRRANLNGSQERPQPVTTAATGSVALTINPDRTRIDYTLITAGPFTSNVTQSHIHIGSADVAGSIVLFFCTNLTPPANVPRPQACPTTGGTISGFLTADDFIPSSASAIAAGTGAGTFADAVANILRGNAYANVHTVTNGSGEIRGQLVQ